MGEIADMMLEGDMCECCGSFIDCEGGWGIPRYCSPECAADRGAACDYSESDAEEEDRFWNGNARSGDMFYIAPPGPARPAGQGLSRNAKKRRRKREAAQRETGQ